jgi:hypothetical protein
MCNIERSKTNHHDVEMMKVLIGDVPALLQVLQSLNEPITHNHYHHQTSPDVGSNPYRNAKTVCELEKLLLSEPKSNQRETLLKHLAKFPESMPVEKIPMPTQAQNPKVKLLR